uniref:Uncharacterized protein n=1 Tax=Sus scrofa TaxID=9823 RepID=A0A8D0QD88_PIG
RKIHFSLLPPLQPPDPAQPSLPSPERCGVRDALCPPTGSPSMVTAITIMALYSIVCVVGLFGNFLVMYVIVR